MNRQKNIALIAGLVIIVLIIWSLSVYISHHDKAKITVVVLPVDSVVTMDGVPFAAGSVYIKIGDHSLVAKRPGFTPAKKEVTIKKDSGTIYLLPAPSSDQAFQYLKAHPDIQAQREAYGSVQDQVITSELNSSSPIIKLLPYSDELGPFSLNYGFTTNDNKGFYLTISNSSPEGRVAALKWIRDHGYNPTDFNIIFGGFANPFTTSKDGASE